MIQLLFKVLVYMENIRILFDSAREPNKQFIGKSGTQYDAEGWLTFQKGYPYYDPSTGKLWSFDDETNHWTQLNRVTYRKSANTFSGYICRFDFSIKRRY